MNLIKLRIRKENDLKNVRVIDAIGVAAQSTEYGVRNSKVEGKVWYRFEVSIDESRDEL